MNRNFDSRTDAEIHLFHSCVGTHLFLADGSRIYDLESESAVNPPTLETLCENLELEATGGYLPRYIDDFSLKPPPLAAISLNVSQACNMSCGYCYADTGKFGGKSRLMSLETARASVDRLFCESDPDIDIVIGYMGGEPLLNRKVIHETTKYAARKAERLKRRIRFSLTTNGTLLQREDAELFSDYPFTVSVSIDGDHKSNDSIRRMNDGSSNLERLSENLDLFRFYGRPNYLTARATVTPETGELLSILDFILSLGFDEVGFAPVIVSPDPALIFQPEHFALFLTRMIACGEKALKEIIAGRVYPFSNFQTAIYEIHRGSHKPYPCGAGAAYLSANADGELFACHRLIDEPQFAMGNVRTGSDIKARFEHLALNHVDLMEPCRNCWARYLCGGGCYHEVSRRGRDGCEYIRGWLDFCLRAYVELSLAKPDYFHTPDQIKYGEIML